MKNYRRIFISLACTSLFLGACSQTDTKENPVSNEQESETVYTITDDLNRTVEVKSPQRVAALIGSFADLWVSAGGQDTLAAAAHDTWTSFAISTNGVQDVGEVKNINTEALLGADCDLVIASAKNDSQKELLSLLDNAGIPVLYFDVSSFEDYLRVLDIFTDLTGRKDLYQTNGLDLQQEIEEINAKAKEQDSKTAVYIRITKSSVKTVNWSNSVLGQMLSDFGAVNALGNEQEGEFSMEALLAADPDQIYLVYQGSNREVLDEQAQNAFFSLPAWSQLTAVQNDQVFEMDPSLFNLKPNARWAQAAETLYETMFDKSWKED
jgi:iron complex transport system substrate-binding protein